MPEAVKGVQSWSKTSRSYAPQSCYQYGSYASR